MRCEYGCDGDVILSRDLEYVCTTCFCVQRCPVWDSDCNYAKASESKYVQDTDHAGDPNSVVMGTCIMNNGTNYARKLLQMEVRVLENPDKAALKKDKLFQDAIEDLGVNCDEIINGAKNVYMKVIETTTSLSLMPKTHKRIIAECLEKEFERKNKSTLDIFDKLGVSKKTKLNDDIKKHIDSSYDSSSFDDGDIQYTSKIKDLCVMFFHSVELQKIQRICFDLYKLYRDNLGSFKPSAVAAGIVILAFNICKLSPLCDCHKPGYCHNCISALLNAMSSDNRFGNVSQSTLKNVLKDINSVGKIQTYKRNVTLDRLA